MSRRMFYGLSSFHHGLRPHVAHDHAIGGLNG